MNLTRVVTISLALIFLAGVCFLLSDYMMRGLQNCDAWHSIPMPKNCENRQSLMAMRVFAAAGLGLLVLAVFFPFFTIYRHNKFSKDEMDSIKITE